MGWSGGTTYFDGGLDIFLAYVPEEDRPAVIAEWYDIIAEGDWDTEEESGYWDLLEPILKEKHPDWQW